MGEHKHGVPERAKKRKQKTLIYSIIGVVAIVVLIIAIAMFGGKQGNPDDVTDPTETTAATEATEPVVITPAKIGEIADEQEVLFDMEIEQSEFYVGDVVKYGDAKIVFVSGEDVVVGEEVNEAAHKLVTVKFAAENIGDSELDISFYNFSAYIGDKSVPMEYEGADYLSADLSAGRFATGYLYFKAPVDADKIEIHYVDEKQSDAAPVIKFIYDGMADSGYVGQAEVKKSEDAISVGTTRELNNRKVTYVGCSEYVHDDVEDQPREGYRFISIEFEVENIADSGKEDITSWDFACYADNMPCRTVHIRDNDLEGLLPAGESMTGTVTFEVPIDAEIIEAEYLYDYKTRDRAIFSIELPVE